MSLFDKLFGRKDTKKQEMVDRIYEAQGAQKAKKSRCPQCGQPIVMTRPEGTLGAWFPCPNYGTKIRL